MQNACTHRSHHFGFARCEPYRTELRCRRGNHHMPSFNRQRSDHPYKQAETPCRILLGSKTSESPDVHVSRLSSCVLISIFSSSATWHLAFSLARSHCIVGIFSSPITIADSDPRMSQIVIHGGIVYLSGQVDQEATDAEGQTKGKQSRHIA